MSESVRFDRAAEIYDRTRAISPEAMARTTKLLASEFDGRGRVLEVGVGTGLLALPLHEAGVPLAGLDLTEAMVRKLLEKTSGAPPFPLVLGDATRMPLADAAFGGAYLRWVLHLIPAWRGAIREIARAVRPKGLFLAALGNYGGPQSEMQAHYAEVAEVSLEPVGLTWDGRHELDAEISSLGGERLPDVSFVERPRDDLEHFMRSIEANRHSWTWKVVDDARRVRAAAYVRSWAESRWGPLDRVPQGSFELRYAVYRLP